MTKAELIEIFFTGRALKFLPADPDVSLSPGVIVRRALVEVLDKVLPDDCEIHDGIECSRTSWLLVLDTDLVAISTDLNGKAVKIVVAFSAASDLAPITEWHYQAGADQQVYLSELHVKGLPFPVASSRELLPVGRLIRFFHAVLAAQRRSG